MWFQTKSEGIFQVSVLKTFFHKKYNCFLISFRKVKHSLVHDNCIKVMLHHFNECLAPIHIMQSGIFLKNMYFDLTMTSNTSRIRSNQKGNCLFTYLLCNFTFEKRGPRTLHQISKPFTILPGNYSNNGASYCIRLSKNS